MINSKQELNYYLEVERQVYGAEKVKSIRTLFKHLFFCNHYYKFMRCLRKLEYYTNTRGILRYFYTYRLGKLRSKTQIDMSTNVAEVGLHIPHGKIVIHSNARVGKHCKILSDVTIGASGVIGEHGVPIIGNNVYIGSGVKIIGDVRIADGVVIGANSVVIRDIDEPYITVAGIPARKVSSCGSEKYIPGQSIIAK